MVTARMSGLVTEAPQKSIGLGFDSRLVTTFPFLSSPL